MGVLFILYADSTWFPGTLIVRSMWLRTWRYGQSGRLIEWNELGIGIWLAPLQWRIEDIDAVAHIPCAELCGNV